MKKLFAFFMTLLLVFGCEEIPLTPEAMITLDTEQSRNISIPSEGGVADISFTSALDWTAGIEYDSGEEGWISLNLTSGKGGYSIVRLKLNIHENLDPEKRSANVVIASGTEKVSISVTQDGHQNEGPIQEEAPVFKLSDKKAEVGAEGGRIQVTVEFNVDYYYEISADWIKEVETKSVDSRIHTFEIAENTDETPRTGTISFCGNYSCIPFSVTQAAAEPKPYLDIDVENLYMPVAGRSEKVGIASNVAWKVECDAEWLSVSPVAGEGDGSIDVNASANDGTELRSAVISISAADGSIVRSLVVIQEAEAKVFELKDKAADVGAEGGFIYVTVRHNVDYRCEVSSDWIKEIETKAIAENIHTFEIAANPSEESRSAVISFAGNGETIPFTVEQDAYVPDSYLELSLGGWSSLPADYDGDPLVVNVSSNTDWLIEDVADWVIVDPVSGSGNGSFSVNVRKNESAKPRETSFTVRTSDGSVKRVFSVNQEGYIPRLELSTGGWSSLPADYDGALVVNVSSDTDWLIEDVADWVIVDPVSGSGNGSFSVNVRRNESAKPRETSFTVRTSDGSVKRVFSVNQEGAEPYFRLDSQAAEVKAEGGKVAVTVIANIEYSYEIPVEWIKEVDAVGNVHTFEIEANEDISQRRATISFCGNGNCLPFIITQAGKIPQHVLEVDRKDLSVPASGTDVPLQVNVTSDTSWNVESDSGWCMVTPSSGINNGVFNVTVGENASSEPRVALITVSSSDGFTSREIAVIQAPASSGTEDDSWIQEEFVHRSLMMRFTADWCGYCPIMATSVHMAQEELPDKIEALSVHGGGSGLASRASDALVNHYGIGSFPTGLVDGRTQIQNNDPSVTAERIINAVNDTEAKYETLTGASWTSSVDGSHVVLNLSLYMKKSGSYKVTALLVEDGIIGYQADYTNGSSENYEHNGVIRSAFTDAVGDEFTQLEEGQRKDFNYSVNIPYGCNKDNLKIVVYVQKREKGSFYVDNAASAAVGQTKMLAVKSGNWGSGNEGIVPGDDINL